ncbi:MAG: helix-turn-helix domain-containing protein [Alphaproteobacteria bacterium]|nr:helix-turn-helix domain-containing protein [Alphaproteobacteria bacterium]
MLEIAANLAVETATAVAGHRKTARDFGLTTREYDCLRWTADSKTDQDIADLLGLAVRTVEDHGASLRRKLDAVNRAHLVTGRSGPACCDDVAALAGRRTRGEPRWPPASQV